MKNDLDMQKYKSGKEAEHLYVFSEEHNERMKTIFKMAEQARKRVERRKRFSRIAAGVAVFFCLSTVMVFQVEAFRLPVIHFFMEMKEKSTLFGSHEESHLGLAEEYRQYEPGYALDGYVVVAVHEDEKGFYIRYEDSTSYKWYTYHYWSKIEGLDVDTENGNVWKETINGNLTVIVQKDDEIRITMSNGMQRFHVSGTISYEEGIKIIESIKCF